VGIESETEFIDLELTELRDLEAIRAVIAPELPVLLPLRDLQLVDKSAPGLSADLQAVRYQVDLECPEAELEQRIQTFLAAEKVECSRVKTEGKDRGKVRIIDLRQVVLSVRTAGPKRIVFELRAGQEASAKPAEVLAGVFAGVKVTRIVKTDVVFAPPPPPPAELPPESPAVE